LPNSARPTMLLELEQIAQILYERINKHQTSGRTLTLKVKFSDYQLLTRSKTLMSPINELDRIAAVAKELFEAIEIGDRSVRLLGISLSNLNNVKSAKLIQLSLFE
jgi:DNA polymerase IV